MADVLFLLVVVAVSALVGFSYGAAECPCRDDPEVVEAMRALESMEEMDRLDLAARMEMWRAAREAVAAGDEDQSGS